MAEMAILASTRIRQTGEFLASTRIRQIRRRVAIAYEKVNFLPIEMVNNFICRTCSRPKLPYLT